MLDQPNLGSHPTAIISDNDEFFRVALRSLLLERNGFAEVIETASFEEAVDMLENMGAVDVGLFDLKMVGMENWGDLSALRGEFPEMLLIIVTASRQREDILRALEIGAHGFISKGLGASELSRAVAQICNGQVYVPPFLPESVFEAPPVATEIMTPEVHVAPQEGTQTPAPPTAPAPIPANAPHLLHCSPRQREVIDLLIAGHSNKGMARTLNLSEGTIKFHMSAVLRLLGANSRVEAATRAMKLLQGEAP
jgi:DNA-binding NarL/FixJ family response regulator